MKRLFSLLIIFFTASIALAEFNYHGGTERRSNGDKLYIKDPMTGQTKADKNLNFWGGGYQNNGTINLKQGTAKTDASYSFNNFRFTDSIPNPSTPNHQPQLGNMFVISLSKLLADKSERALISYNLGRYDGSFSFMLDCSKGLKNVTLLLDFNATYFGNNCISIPNLDLSAEKNTLLIGYQRSFTKDEARIFCQVYNGRSYSPLQFSEEIMGNWGFNIENIQFGKNADNSKLKAQSVSALIENVYFYTIDAITDLGTKDSQKQIKTVNCNIKCGSCGR